MNIRTRLKNPDTKGRKISQGFSLLRRCYDEHIIAKCVQLQDHHRNIAAYVNEQGYNKIAVYTLFGGDILQRRRQLEALGNLSVRRVLHQTLEEVPSMMTRPVFTVASLRMRQNLRNSRGQYYLEAVFDEDSKAWLQGEIDNIRASLQGCVEDDGPALTWPENVPLHLGLAVTGPLATTAFVESVEQTANELLQPPFRVELTSTQLTLPRA